MMNFADFRDHIYTIKSNREQTRFILTYIQSIEKDKYSDLLHITNYEAHPKKKGATPDDRIINALQRADDTRELWLKRLDALPAEDPDVINAINDLQNINGVILKLFIFSGVKASQLAEQYHYERTSIYDKIKAGIKQAYKLYCERLKADTDDRLTDHPEAEKSA